jgi:signal transduction histidine kinase
MRIATKLTLLLLLAVSAVLAGFGYLRIQQERNRLIEELQQEVVVLANAMGLAVEHALRDRQPEDIRELLTEIVRDPNPVDRIRIFNGRLEEINRASTDAAASTTIPQEEWDRVLKSGELRVQYLATAPRPVVYVVLPLKNRRGGIIGGLEIIHLATRVQRQIDEATRDLALRMGLLSLTIAVVIWLTVRMSIRRPIRALVRAALAVGRGHLDQRISVRRRDEVGQLASAFNRMAEDLQAARQGLVTESQARLDTERQLQQEQKLAAIGRLASEVAHEIGTPMNIISGRVESIQKALPPDHPVGRHTVTVLRQVERVSEIIRHLLEYARPRRPAARPVAVAPVLDRVADLLGPLAQRHQVQLTAEAGQTLPMLLADPDQLQQVLLNLVTNALDATPAGGQVRLTAGADASPASSTPMENRSVVRRGFAGTPHVTICVADTGCGIPADRLEKIFEPFFSTKDRRGGTGLGMSIVEDIARAHRAALAIESAEGLGTTVRLHWPVAPADQAAPSGDSNPADPEALARP